jgi:hypothetical protein
MTSQGRISASTGAGVDPFGEQNVKKQRQRWSTGHPLVNIHHRNLNAGKGNRRNYCTGSVSTAKARH